ncbi:hypothetical protein [Flavobacterium luteum]|uniref:Uncharacterized protein n=1 Tax=Flavobacterium luteum TaxID=2026654 RepID=A0A7J5AK55_9FLAO|nr:hypothetical protein [Flavobacterium luteum]KAB1157925.1 hypothetical protein F6464_02250 [Flavobacterium luteum]
MINRVSFENNPSEVEKLLNVLNERVFLKTEIDIVYSDLVNWERYNLLSIGGDSDKGDWKKLNYIEYTWVKIIQELRQYGFTYDEILLCKTEIFKLVKQGELIEASKVDSKNVKQQLGSEAIEELNAISDSNYDENLNIEISIFETIMASAIISGVKWSFLFFKEMPGFYFPISTEAFRGFDLINKPGIPMELLSKTFLSVSLSDIISNFLVDGENSYEERTISILTKNEHKLLKQIRKGYNDVKSIKIRFKNDQMEMIEVTTLKKVKLESRLLEHIKKGDYQTISIDTVDGKIVNFENTQKIKL